MLRELEAQASNQGLVGMSTGLHSLDTATGRIRLAAALLLLATSWLQPWYAVWAVPLAAVEEDQLARVLTVAICAYFLRDALPV